MPSSYTTSLKIQEIANGEQSGYWGTTTNTNWTLVEQAIAGVETITMANANYTLSNLNGILDEARNMVLVISGTNSAVFQVIAPLVPKFYVIRNATSGGYAITIGGATGSVVTIANGTVAQVYCDGTNFYSAQTGSSGNFNVNGNLVVSGTSTLAATTATTLDVSGAATFVTSPTAPTPSAGDSSTKVATTAFVSQNSVPTGSLLMWPTAGAPSGFLQCNGSAVSRSTYSALFAIIGTTFGSGDGSTTFNLPNYVDRMPIGAGNLYSANSQGGSKDAIVVSHSHTASSTSNVNDPTHRHQQADNSATNISGGGGAGGGGSRGGSGAMTYYSATGITVSTTTTVDSAGSTGTNANLPPYLGVYFIIKT